MKIAPDMSTAVTNGHQAGPEDFAKHVFGGKNYNNIQSVDIN